MNRQLIYCTLLVFLCGACAKQATVGPYQVPPITFGSITAPQSRIADFQKADSLVYLTIHSKPFRDELAKLIDFHRSNPAAPYAAAWQGLQTGEISTKMEDMLQGLSIKTYRGPVAVWKFFVFGNLAYDGTAAGPILINATLHKQRTHLDFANTIAHEAAHRIGLTHPHSDDDLSIAFCEPPYVIGSLVQKLAGGQAWKWDSNDCVHLKPRPAQLTGVSR